MDRIEFLRERRGHHEARLGHLRQQAEDSRAKLQAIHGAMQNEEFHRDQLTAEIAAAEKAAAEETT